MNGINLLMDVNVALAIEAKCWPKHCHLQMCDLAPFFLMLLIIINYSTNPCSLSEWYDRELGILVTRLLWRRAEVTSAMGHISRQWWIGMQNSISVRTWWKLRDLSLWPQRAMACGVPRQLPELWTSLMLLFLCLFAEHSFILELTCKFQLKQTKNKMATLCYNQSPHSDCQETWLLL